MNVIFITISRIQEIESQGIYKDLMRKFRDEGHSVYIVSPNERQFNRPTTLIERDGVKILGVKTLNIQKTSTLEKGIGTVLLEGQYIDAIKKHLKGIRFDLILYSTPPITVHRVVKHLKKRNPKALSYLMLKDIFPQNAVDLGMMSKTSLIYRFFRRKEKKLYELSDRIGCMSPANVRYVLEQNREIAAERVEVCPNSMELRDTHSETAEKDLIRKKYGLPLDLPLFIYGGNLGKPQGVDFLIQCLEHNKERKDCYFLIIGSGTEYKKLEEWFEQTKAENSKLLSGLPTNEYNALVESANVGLIFLDHRFTIPNFPSRLLSYLACKKPIIAATDKNSDMGQIAQENGFGYFCESRKPEDFTLLIEKFIQAPESIEAIGNKGYEFLRKNYLVEHSYNPIIAHLDRHKKV